MTQFDLPPPPGYELQARPPSRVGSQTTTSSRTTRTAIWYFLLLPYFLHQFALAAYSIPDDGSPPEWLYNSKTFAFVAGVALVGVLILGIERLSQKTGV